MYGDPLPPGAVARLGTVRLRIPYFNSAMFFSADGKTLVTGGGDTFDLFRGQGWRGTRKQITSAVRFWDATTGKLLRHFNAETLHIRSLAMTADESLLAVCGDDKEVRLWKAANGQSVRRLPTEHQTGYVCFSPNGKMLAATTIRNTIHLWDVDGGREIRTITTDAGIYNRISRLSFAPDGKFLVGALSQKGGLIIWEADSGKVAHELFAGKLSFHAIAFSSDGKRVAVGGEERIIRILDVTTGKEFCQTDGSAGPTMGLRFESEGKTVAAIGWEGVSFFDAAKGTLIRRVWKDKTNLQGPVAFAPDGKTMAWSFYHGIRLVDLETGKERIPVSGSEYLIGWADFSPDGKSVATSGGKLRLWDVGTMREKAIESKDAVSCAAFTPDGQQIVVACPDQTLRLRETATGKEIRRFIGTPGAVEHMQLLPGGKNVLSIARDQITRNGEGEMFSPDKFARVWDLATGKEIRKIDLTIGNAGSAALSPDRRLLSNGHVVVDVEKNAITQQLERNGMPFCVAFTGDSKRVATAANEEAIRLYDVATGKVVRRFEGFEGVVLSLACSRDNRYLASGGADHCVRLWDLHTGALLNVFRGHHGLIRAVAFSPDSELLLSGSDDTTVLIWEVPRRPVPAK
jgi:WD40 repeat protein